MPSPAAPTIHYPASSGSAPKLPRLDPDLVGAHEPGADALDLALALAEHSARAHVADCFLRPHLGAGPGGDRGIPNDQLAEGHCDGGAYGSRLLAGCRIVADDGISGGERLR
ncbi:MAG: hypothetical protein ACOY0T_30995 [Myxococcota bacterium]